MFQRNIKFEQLPDLTLTKVVDGTSCKYLTTRYSRFSWETISEQPELQNALEKQASKGPLYDLGSGRPDDHPASKYGYKELVAVDLFTYQFAHMRKEEKNSLNKFMGFTCRESSENGLSIKRVEADMLTFINKLPDKSCHSITISGIDDCVIDPSNDYHLKLAEQVIRVSAPGALVFGFNSWVFNSIERLWRFSERGELQNLTQLKHCSDSENKFFVLAN